MRKLTLAGAVLAVLAPFATVVAPASAAPSRGTAQAAPAVSADVGPFDMEQSFIGGGVPDVLDKCGGCILQLREENEDWSEVSCQVVSGRSWCELKDTSGHCANVAADRYVWANSCQGTTSEQWWKTGALFVNRHWGYSYYLNAIEGTDGVTWYVYLAASALTWSTPGS
jgi:hypothetical protein